MAPLNNQAIPCEKSRAIVRRLSCILCTPALSNASFRPLYDVAIACQHRPRQMRRPAVPRQRSLPSSSCCGPAHNPGICSPSLPSIESGRSVPAGKSNRSGRAGIRSAARAKPYQDERERRAFRHHACSTLLFPGQSETVWRILSFSCSESRNCVRESECYDEQAWRQFAFCRSAPALSRLWISVFVQPMGRLD